MAAPATISIAAPYGLLELLKPPAAEPAADLAAEARPHAAARAAELVPGWLVVCTDRTAHTLSESGMGAGWGGKKEVDVLSMLVWTVQPADALGASNALP